MSFVTNFWLKNDNSLQMERVELQPTKCSKSMISYLTIEVLLSTSLKKFSPDKLLHVVSFEEFFFTAYSFSTMVIANK